MKKIALTLATLLAGSAFAATITLYQDKDTGALYTKPGKNRIPLGEFISKDEVVKTTSDLKKEMSKELKGTIVGSKVPKLKINGVHYLGFTHIDNEDGSDINRFETRRNYLQVKAYWNEKDYMRLTVDTHEDETGDWKVRLKYAYIYLDNILPYTGVEFGQVHRPWIDWEEHHGWLYRSIAKTFVEEHHGAHLTNSADQGINFKTKTEYFSSEVGLFNGEGYHDKTAHDNKRVSFEWRLTAHLLGTGKEHVHPTSDTYADVSFLGQINSDYKNDAPDFNWYAIHAVYNQPLFLIAGMYAKASHKEGSVLGSKKGDGWSVNAELRPIKKWAFFARYDKWNDKHTATKIERDEWIAGAAYTYNKNVKFIANVFAIDPNDKIDNDEQTRYMISAEVKW